MFIKEHDCYAERAKRDYSPAYAAEYRASDEVGVDHVTHTDIGDLLTEVSHTFGHPVDVLDLGCGTGRYWHHLRNVRTLIGVDISPDMLRQAKHPIREEAVIFPRMLVCANLADIELPDKRFDLVYAIGVLGRAMPLDAFMVNKVSRTLKPGGLFVVSASDRATHEVKTMKRRLVKAVLPLLPKPWKWSLQAHMRDFSLTEVQMRDLFSGWQNVVLTRRTGGGTGKTEWMCKAMKA